MKTKNKTNVCLILGTRPEIIKFFPIIVELERKGIKYLVIHTDQHYDFKMDGIFFEELKLKPKIIHLNIGSGTHGEITGKAIIEIEKVLLRKMPRLVVVQGDTNTALAGAIASVKLDIKVCHVEAGLRSYDKNQPEEFNRKIIDHISSYLFAPTKASVRTLISEGIKKDRIYLTGNTSVDSILSLKKDTNGKKLLIQKLGLKKENFFLATIHRQENVDFKDRLEGIIDGLSKVSKNYNILVVLPLHPRTKKRILEFSLTKKIDDSSVFLVLDPLGIDDMLSLEQNARAILTDSGGIIEEACTLKIPSVSLRNFSDRPESVEVGASLLAGHQPEKIFKMTKMMLSKKKTWKNPYGDGKAGKKIVAIISRKIVEEN